eukprot:1631009-Amphidinium_carterae.1
MASNASEKVGLCKPRESQGRCGITNRYWFELASREGFLEQPARLLFVSLSLHERCCFQKG